MDRNWPYLLSLQSVGKPLWTSHPQLSCPHSLQLLWLCGQPTGSTKKSFHCGQKFAIVSVLFFALTVFATGSIAFFAVSIDGLITSVATVSAVVEI